MKICSLLVQINSIPKFCSNSISYSIKWIMSQTILLKYESKPFVSSRTNTSNPIVEILAKMDLNWTVLARYLVKENEILSDNSRYLSTPSL